MIKHECAVAMVALRKPQSSTANFGVTKLSLLLEKQHNRGQDGAGAAILAAHPEPGEAPYQLFKSATSSPLADLLGQIGKCGKTNGKIFLGHLRYATFGKNDVAFCHPFVHQASELRHTLLLAGNFNLTNAHELFESYRDKGEFPTSRADAYLITELVAHELERGAKITNALQSALCDADGAWTLCGMTGDGWAFATRDSHGIRPGWYYADENVVVVASERPAILAAFDVPIESVKELPPGMTLTVSPSGALGLFKAHSDVMPLSRQCVFERIYFSRANDRDIHRERKALGAALAPSILAAANAPLERIFFSYIPNSARIAFYGLLERLFDEFGRVHFGEVIVKDAKFRTFIADAAARREFYKHVYDVAYALVDPNDTLVVIDDSIVRGNTMKNAILPMLDRLGPKRIVIASSAPPIRYPDCYGIDMSTLGELVAFKALVNLLGNDANEKLSHTPLKDLYASFSDDEHNAEIARLLTPPGMKAEVKVVYQSIDALRKACPNSTGDWYFTGDYPTSGGCKVLQTALHNYIAHKSARSY